MQTFLESLRTQRWDDHRYYHHSRVNQSLHLVSAVSFLAAYGLAFSDPVAAALVAWLVAMTTRQAGHFFFEPKGYDHVNHATHEYKEAIKVGYNLRRKAVLLLIWAATPLVVWVDPTLLGLLPPDDGRMTFMERVGTLWFGLGVAALLFRTLQLFVQQDVATGCVWLTKILTDPFHDIKLYHKAPLQLLRGERLDPAAPNGHA
jgi:hypothetical protein